MDEKYHERFWGAGIGLLVDLSYAAITQNPVVGLYLALIEEVEKYVRYEPDHPNYIRNTADARDMYDMAFGVMKD